MNYFCPPVQPSLFTNRERELADRMFVSDAEAVEALQVLLKI